MVKSFYIRNDAKVYKQTDDRQSEQLTWAYNFFRRKEVKIPLNTEPESIEHLREDQVF